MPTRLPFILCGVLFLVAGASPSLAQPRVVATIPPLHSLAALVMEGAGYPQLLLKGTESPHSYSLRPSQTRMLASADIVIRIGPTFEVFVNKPLRALSGRAKVVDLEKAAGIRHLPVRDHHAGHDHGHLTHEAARDPHIWLHTGNAVAMIGAMAAALASKDPGNAALYRGNAGRASIRLRSLKMEIDRIIRPARPHSFVTFHDAWQYFAAEFGLKSAGALTLNPERKPGARRLARIRQTIRTSGARCLFAEPQFPEALARVAVRGTPAKIGILDPVGSDLATGSELYFSLMRRTANNMAMCLESPAG